ncbi:hydroxysteroid dehydrogenase 1 [Artemisia annua]|uniref:Hydroxysteroid dehydrogenase 1 n=1 Tax=Artemisia annua TaxID=35608 RepID=A0A2U1QAL0_ARTAN|nr:hydroxysteroid dehydrogenase 1 [Artemisia annua]
MRIDFGSDIKIALVTPGFIEFELTQRKFLLHEGRTIVNPDARDGIWPCMIEGMAMETIILL